MLTVHKEALTDSCFVVLGAHLPALQQLTLDDVALGASRLEAVSGCAVSQLREQLVQACMHIILPIHAIMQLSASLQQQLTIAGE